MVLNQGLFKTVAVGDVFSAKNCSLNTLIMLNRDISTLQHFNSVFPIVLRSEVKNGDGKNYQRFAHLYHPFTLLLSINK